MILIIGGIAQGKAAFAKKQFPDAEKHLVRLNEPARSWFAAGEDPVKKIEEIRTADPDCILISEEIGNGIVPADPEARAFREWMGRLQVFLAEQADQVIRVVCGLGQKLK